MVSAEEADNLYKTKKYVIDNELKWQPQGDKRWYLKASLVTEDGEELELRGVKGDKFSFSLIYRKSIKVRRFDFQKRHPNKDGTELTGPHKHMWDGNDDDFAYNVYDIDTKDVNKALFDFLKECNIEFLGNYQGIINTKP